ncbi:MAG: Heavy metal transport/detoxification protein [Candidatus Magasanikbacteria bacterium GW2011_GWC2_37_14]|uniref:Heavy metal transport/detoxification protein n=1 Tax=Candidatus Magasanikbacteria bacterium GW2011_GWC2_37_14 TaxID=1619046 RepID=A0A0G0G902_9BACT|nr:MAG: Heavy metal transport/detoxification protein [Candidatus Magasanikbacteria bacterium GW2011_GWC2_37_14]
MQKLLIPIKGMHCKSCEILVGNNLKKLPDVKEVFVDSKIGEAKLSFENQPPAEALINQAVADAGYSVGKEDKKSLLSKDKNDYLNLLKSLVILLILFFLWKMLGLGNLGASLGDSAGLGAALLIGLVAGVSTCMAIIGGLVLSLSARHAELHPEASAWQKFRPHLFFNLGRIGGFFILGGIIGWLGSAFKLSNNFLVFLTLAVSLVMIFLGLKLLNIFPFLQNKNISLPKSISKKLGIGNDTKEYSHRGAMLSGALTFFLPCGFTQAMQLYAVSTGSFFLGGLSLAIFAFGTSFGLLGIGVLSSVFRGKKAKVFFSVAGLIVIVLGLFNINNSLNLFSAKVDKTPLTAGAITDEVQIVNMTQDYSGYSPNVLTVKKGVPVRWVINSTNPYTCASSLVMRKYNISRSLQKGENIIEFTPTEAGEIPFSCSMGMYRGKFIVQ